MARCKQLRRTSRGTARKTCKKRARARLSLAPNRGPSQRCFCQHDADVRHTHDAALTSRWRRATRAQGAAPPRRPPRLQPRRCCCRWARRSCAWRWWRPWRCAACCLHCAGRAPPQHCVPLACRSSHGAPRCRGACIAAAAAACWTQCARAPLPQATAPSVRPHSMHPASPVAQRPCSLSLTTPGALAGAVVGEHAFVHVACPALARAALAGGATKAPFYSAFKGFVGEGLFTAEGEDWRVPRHLKV